MQFKKTFITIQVFYYIVPIDKFKLIAEIL